MLDDVIKEIVFNIFNENKTSAYLDFEMNIFS